MSGDVEWLTAGKGMAPRQSWAYSTDAPLVALEMARESGELLAADEAGGLYLLDRKRQVLAVSRSFHDVLELAWSDTGSSAAALLGERQVCRINRRFEREWSLDLYDDVVAIAVDPYGNHVAIALANGHNLVYDAHKQRVCRFETERPLSFVKFITSESGLLGAAEYGLICRHELEGAPVWSEKLWSNVGDLTATGDGSSVYVAGFAHGVQVFRGDGQTAGSYILEGTPKQIACTFAPKRIVAATLEQDLYWLAADGQLLWASKAPDDIRRVCCDPLGNWVICGFASGRIIRLEW